jgi:hypothetical protein
MNNNRYWKYAHGPFLFACLSHILYPPPMAREYKTAGRGISLSFMLLKKTYRKRKRKKKKKKKEKEREDNSQKRTYAMVMKFILIFFFFANY